MGEQGLGRREPLAENRPLPYAGDRAVARSVAAVHVRNPWTGRWRACRDRYPCRDRQDANAVLGATAVARRRRFRSLWAMAALLASVLVGMLLVAYGVLGLAR
ncbi:MAG: hypothetical protein ACRDT1_12345 [Micromonosporaceae bacterium]